MLSPITGFVGENVKEASGGLLTISLRVAASPGIIYFVSRGLRIIENTPL
jgi:hypothetical protein